MTTWLLRHGVFSVSTSTLSVKRVAWNGAGPSAFTATAQRDAARTIRSLERGFIPALLREPGMVVVRALAGRGFRLLTRTHAHRVALKVIRGGAYVTENQVRMFRREAQTLARLVHPNIASIYDSGRTSDGQHFFCMELVHGEPLAFSGSEPRAGCSRVMR
jgi:serine/threonine protein kinase